MKDYISRNVVVRFIFGILICGMFTACAAALLYLPIPEDNRSAVDILIGSLSTLIGMVFTFYFGSSDGSSRKSDTIDKILKDSQTTINDIVPPYEDEGDYEEVQSVYRSAGKTKPRNPPRNPRGKRSKPTIAPPGMDYDTSEKDNTKTDNPE